MRSRLVVALVVMIALPAFAPAPFPKPKKDDQKSLAGTWSVVRYERAGNPVRAAGSLKVRIEGDKWMFLNVNAAGTGSSTIYTITLDSKKDPSCIDLTMSDMRVKMAGGNKLMGIYRFDRSDRNKVQIVFHIFGVTERPIGFDGTDKKAYLMILQRDKP